MNEFIDLPPLPDLPAYPAEVFDREVRVVSETMVEQLMHDYARAAIENFLNQSGQYLTNDATRQVAIDEAIKADRQLRGDGPTFRLGDHVRKTKGSHWKGRVVGTYSTSLTPEGYAVESDTETGSVQIYPAHALELVS